MALNPNIPVVAPGELITATIQNANRSNIDRLDTQRISRGAVNTTTTGNAAVSASLTNVATVSFSAQPVNGIVFYSAIALISAKTVATDTFDVMIYTIHDATLRATVRSLAVGSVSLSIAVAIAAGTTCGANLNAQRSGGTGTANVSGDLRFTRIDAMWVPA